MNPALQVVFLFTDIEGSTRLWEQQREAMRAALAAHDALSDAVLAAHRGRLVKRTGDGVHAVFDDALDAVQAALDLQRRLADPDHTAGLPLRLRCGLHAGADEARDHDFYGPDVNRAARIMAAAHGGQVLLSQAVAEAVAGRLPAGLGLLALGQVRLRDLLRPEPLHQLQAPGLRERFPPLRSLEATPNNLGTQLSRFIGRAQLLSELQTRVRSHRLVTLFGPGGIGKTRLSLQLAADALDAHPDGVWFIELAPLAPGPGAASRLVQVVASTLGLKELPGQPLADTLGQHLRDRHLLLVLDNCEHVLGAAAALARQLLQAAPQLHILASSREVLRVAGESVFSVPALSLPTLPLALREPAVPVLAGEAPATADLDPQALMVHEAVRLFVDRACLSRPDFRLGPGNAAAVVEICHRVEGIPLAIELAAARVRALPVRTVAERLRESFRLLATRDETVALRQRTLAHLIDWSHDMLSEAERVLYRRLSVFAGGFSLEAAEAVCADDAADGVLPVDEVLDVLALLVEKSLLRQADELPTSAGGPDTGDDGAASGGRWRMLETVRQHAAQRLREAEGEAPALRARQLAYFRALAQEASAALGGAQQPRWLARLDQDHENLLSVLAWCAGPARMPHPALASGSPGGPPPADAAGPAPGTLAQGLAMAVALRRYWINRGLMSLALETVRALLQQGDAAQDPALRAEAMTAAGQLCIFMGLHAQAMSWLSASLDLHRSVGDEAAAAAVRQPLGIAAIGLGDTVAARAHFEAAEQAARQQARLRPLAAAVNAVAQVDRLEGQLDAADARYAEFIELARQMGNSEYLAVGLVNRAMVAVMRGLAEGVAPSLLSAARLADANGSRPLMVSILDACGGLAALQADWPRVAWCAGLAQAQARRVGLARDAVDEAFVAPVLAKARQALGEPAYAQANAEGEGSAFEPAWAELERWLARGASALPGDAAGSAA